MFDKDIKINGIYATHLKSLAKDRDGQNVKNRIFLKDILMFTRQLLLLGCLREVLS